MKEKFTHKLGQWLLRRGKFTVCIIDDEEAFFTPEMVNIASRSGFDLIERHTSCDQNLLEDLIANPRDVLILDVKGIVAPPVAQDGLALAEYIYKHTPTYVALTSAHSFQMGEFHKNYDRLISDRFLTALDFVSVLNSILDDYLNRKASFYKRISLRVGTFIIRKSALASA